MDRESEIEDMKAYLAECDGAVEFAEKQVLEFANTPESPVAIELCNIAKRNRKLAQGRLDKMLNAAPNED